MAAALKRNLRGGGCASKTDAAGVTAAAICGRKATGKGGTAGHVSLRRAFPRRMHHELKTRTVTSVTTRSARRSSRKHSTNPQRQACRMTLRNRRVSAAIIRGDSAFLTSRAKSVPARSSVGGIPSPDCARSSSPDLFYRQQGTSARHRAGGVAYNHRKERAVIGRNRLQRGVG
jgi:hypothetical protein